MDSERLNEYRQILRRIQHDGTNRPVANALLDEGIPKDAIVLGFYPADEWPDAGFGMA